MTILPAAVITPVTTIVPSPYGGIPAPIGIASISQGFYPYGYGCDAQTVTITASRNYYVPFPVFTTTTFAGFQMADTGASNNGQHVRPALFAEKATGGPGLLLKDFGIISLTASPGLHQAASSVTVTGPQMCYLALVGDAGSVLNSMSVNAPRSSVGSAPISPTASLLGDIGGIIIATGNAGFQPIGWYAAGAYGAWGSNPPAPATNLSSSPFTGAGALPAMQLYL